MIASFFEGADRKSEVAKQFQTSGRLKVGKHCIVVLSILYYLFNKALYYYNLYYTMHVDIIIFIHVHWLCTWQRRSFKLYQLTRWMAHNVLNRTGLWKEESLFAANRAANTAKKMPENCLERRSHWRGMFESDRIVGFLDKSCYMPYVLQ